VIQENSHRPLGASGIKVSSLGTGTNRWAQGKNDEAVFKAYQSLLNAGVNFFDTAEVYNRGKSERLLGACLRRDNRPVVIASKFAPFPTRVSRRQFMNALDASLSRLDVQTIDLYYIHFREPFLSGSPSSTDEKEKVLREILQRIALQRGESVSQVALNWLLRKDIHVA
jgi:aryl-alcohol dehydrogenase-like predicted oxidoreductase